MAHVERVTETIYLYPYKIDITHERYASGDPWPQELVSVARLSRCLGTGAGHLAHVYGETWPGQPQASTASVREPLRLEDGGLACDRAQTRARGQLMQAMRQAIGE